MKVSGHIYFNGKLRHGTIDLSGVPLFKAGIANDGLYGTLIPVPINAHTHVGDSFIGDEPSGTLPDIVGPGGLKHRMLEHAGEDSIIEGIRNSNRFMWKNGTGSYIDFREGGLNGNKLIRKSKPRHIRPVVLGRPYGSDPLEDILDTSDGIALSSISDIDYEDAMKASVETRRRGKIFALHFSENKREDIQRILDLKPSFLVHGIEADDNDLNLLGKTGIPVAITPRSNIFYGKRPDYGRFIKSGIEVMMGTDNVFITEPDMFSEMDFLYRYQRFSTYINPSDILKFAIDNPRKLLEKNGVSIKEAYIFFKNQLINEYQIVTKKHYFRSSIIHIFE
ncbi:amidohydrolase family protein [Ferroplasma sp.]|uniref:amidohydrolase family protein n=1 Tax=Ferroplasma sp. TaxID=2591003 RepID=UPI002618BD85|nr:amidohydrolase family protein [Ferroplasma sp.]MCL4453493.1 amidohydrolase family protein [Candidatus Thermoplasmatota archaeon]